MVSRDPRPKFTKFGEHASIRQTPNHAKFCRALMTPAVEYLCSRKNGQKFTKIGDDLLYTNTRHFIALGQTVYEKAL